MNHKDLWYMQIVVLWRFWRNDNRILRGSEDHRKSRFVEIGTINLCQRKKILSCLPQETQERPKKNVLRFYELVMNKLFDLYGFSLRIFSMNINEDKRNWNKEDWCEDWAEDLTGQKELRRRVKIFEDCLRC